MKSWAVPRTPPTETGLKRLAVQVEDHSIEYVNFGGTIPEGRYGAGTVEIWDKNHYVLKERTEDRLVFKIEGKKLRGVYCLIRFKRRKNWLFFERNKRLKLLLLFFSIFHSISAFHPKIE